MLKRGINLHVANSFLKHRRVIERSGTNSEMVAWTDIRPFGEDDLLRFSEDSNYLAALEKLGNANLGKCVIVKLNGGRSTTMGGAVPKCTITAKNGKTFLDITMHRIMELNDRFDIEIPLVLMNSFFTDKVTDTLVGRTPLIIMSFIQNEYPRLRSDDLSPLDTATDTDWCPPGHGDFYSSFYDSGILDNLLDLGYRWVFISNIDNLCADVSPIILGLIVERKIDFIMEVTEKTPADVKGGAPVFLNDHPNLLEIAQVPEAHLEDFQDIQRFQYFNTNNIWLDMEAVKKKQASGKLTMPLILNKKHINNIEVIQMETAIGAAMRCFDRPAALVTPRNRFFPIKKMADLFILQSDIFILDEQYRLRPNPQRPGNLNPLPMVTFQDGFMANNDFACFFEDPSSISLVEAESLLVGGNVFFERDVRVLGNVEIQHQGEERKVIPSGTVLKG